MVIRAYAARRKLKIAIIRQKADANLTEIAISKFFLIVRSKILKKDLSYIANSYFGTYFEGQNERLYISKGRL